MEDDRISLAHGNGGRFMRELIEEVFARQLADSKIDVQADAVPIDLGDGEVMITTDGFTVQPLEFPGGNIGSLAVHGTTNDLAVSGARPMYLTLNAFIEEGFEIARLERIIGSLNTAAKEAGVKISAGDTKVVRRGEGGGIYLATTGVGDKASWCTAGNAPDPGRRCNDCQRARWRSWHGGHACPRGIRSARRSCFRRGTGDGLDRATSGARRSAVHA